jgi:hypothetical protein
MLTLVSSVFLYSSISPQMIELDILTVAQATVIPKPHDLDFCFNATASTLKEFYGLTFAPQTSQRGLGGFPHERLALSPQALRFLCVEILDFSWIVSLRDVSPLPFVLFPVYRFVCAVNTLVELRSYRLSAPSSRVGQRPV